MHFFCHEAYDSHVGFVGLFYLEDKPIYNEKEDEGNSTKQNDCEYNAERGYKAGRKWRKHRSNRWVIINVRN